VTRFQRRMCRLTSRNARCCHRPSPACSRRSPISQVGRTGFEPVTHGLKASYSKAIDLQKRYPSRASLHVRDAHEKQYSSRTGGVPPSTERSRVFVSFALCCSPLCLLSRRHSAQGISHLLLHAHYPQTGPARHPYCWRCEPPSDYCSVRLAPVSRRRIMCAQPGSVSPRSSPSRVAVATAGRN